MGGGCPEPDVPMDITPSEPGTEIVAVDIEGKGRNRIELENSALLSCLTECSSRHATIFGLDVTTQLDPKPSLLVEAQEDVCEIWGEDEAARCEVSPATLAMEGGRTANPEEVEVFKAKRVLPVRYRLPGTEIPLND